MKKFTLIFLIGILISCGHEAKVKLTAYDIIEKTFESHGSEKIKKVSISFDFRSFNFEYLPHKTGIIRKRTQLDSLGNKTIDIWNKGSLYRTINGEKILLDEKSQFSIISSLNSVFYFTFLPFSLKDPAVKLKTLNEIKIKGKDYYKIQVTFQEKNGGEDFQDVFIYWINKSTFKIDYLAYKYETDEGGIRFREAYETKMVKGISFQNYHNFEPKTKNISLQNCDSIYLQNEMKFVSNIILENILVNKIN